jgi:adenine-specific DNA-methyltransferase
MNTAEPRDGSFDRGAAAAILAITLTKGQRLNKKNSAGAPATGSKRPDVKKPIEQYEHKDKKRANIPPVGLVTPQTDPVAPARKTYQYDPHLDPQLVWAGKAERTSFEIPTVSLHVHERIDPRTIMEAVKSKNGNGHTDQLPLFGRPDENRPLREEFPFYDHKKPLGWKNRLIAGDSLLVMNSLLEKEGLGGGVQMVYIDPPYGIRYGSNFQPFTNKRDVKDGADDDLTLEPETLKAFRDTWELGIHSYLTYLRDRLLLAKDLLHESGSCFVQISDENVHHIRELMDEVFGTANFCGMILYKKTGYAETTLLSSLVDYVLWYGKDKQKTKFRALYRMKSLETVDTRFFDSVELFDGTRRQLTSEESSDATKIPKGSEIFARNPFVSPGWSERLSQPVKLGKETFECPPNAHWKTTPEGIERLKIANRMIRKGNALRFVHYLADFRIGPIGNYWSDTGTGGFAGDQKVYVVQTDTRVLERCLLMTTDPGDLVLDPTCGSGTTAYVAEQWGRRWITTDTSRVAITLAKQRLMTATFDYYTLAHPEQGVGSGFVYKTVPHVTLKSIANNPEIRVDSGQGLVDSKKGKTGQPPLTTNHYPLPTSPMSREQIDKAIAKYADTETLYDQPEVDNKKARVTGPFTVEAVPAAAYGQPEVRSIEPIEWEAQKALPGMEPDGYLQPDPSIARSGETLRQSEWRTELLKTGIRAKAGAKMEFVRVEPLPGTRWLSADAETKEDKPRRAVISFGPEHEPLEQRQVAQALEEAQTLIPRPALVIFAALQFDPEASKDIDETKWPGVTMLKAQMNGDLVTEDLKKKRSSNESFWLVGQPDVEVVSEQWLVDSKGRKVAPYELGAVVSGLDSLAEINRTRPDDLRVLAEAAARGTLRVDVADATGGGVDSRKHRGGSGETEHGGVSAIPGDIARESGRIGDAAGLIEGTGLRDKRKCRAFVERLRRDQQDASSSPAFTIHYPLTTTHYTQVRVHGFDYYNPRSGKVESGGKANIAMWMLDPDYDGRSVYPRQVFFPMAGPKDGWARLAKNLKAEIDQELIEQYRGTVSLPFPKGKHGRVAVKIVDDRGIESLRIVEVP